MKNIKYCAMLALALSMVSTTKGALDGSRIKKLGDRIGNKINSWKIDGHRFKNLIKKITPKEQQIKALKEDCKKLADGQAVTSEVLNEVLDNQKKNVTEIVEDSSLSNNEKNEANSSITEDIKNIQNINAESPEAVKLKINLTVKFLDKIKQMFNIKID